MSKTVTIRLEGDLLAWLDALAAETGLPRGAIVRDALERSRAASPSARSFMRLAGAAKGPRDLSRRKGFSRS